MNPKLKNNLPRSLYLEGDLVMLRPLHPDDFEAFKPLTSDPEMWTWFTHDLSNKVVLHDWVGSALKESDEGKRLACTVIEKTSGNVAGSTSFGNISKRDRRLEIGWTWLGKDFRGGRLNAEMKYLMMEYTFDYLGFERVESKTDVLNIPARKSLERCGMKEEGILRSHTLMTQGRRRDTIYYSVLKDEWPQVKESYRNHHR
jgi:RimJ/RimL family protein N-acetyltransferase